uniref:MHC class II alpha chain N-terminal domain-containing protein n=1 Tax=Labrus bergylta TaxID=56723 RepID=A0A3Q3L3B8_9LABR
MSGKFVYSAFFLGCKHLLRFLTFCQKNVTGDGQNDIEFDGDQLLHTDTFTHQPVQRLPEFGDEWIPDPGLAPDSWVNLGTCYYNIPRAIAGAKSPAENIEVKDTDQQLVETALCVCGVILGLIGVVTGLWFIVKANKSCQA